MFKIGLTNLLIVRGETLLLDFYIIKSVYLFPECQIPYNFGDFNSLKKINKLRSLEYGARERKIVETYLSWDTVLKKNNRQV